MPAATSPVAITSLGTARATARLFRQGDRLYLAVVVEGTFGIVPGGPIAPVERAAEPRDEPPYLPQVDLVLTGHVDPSNESQAAPPFTVGLGVNQGGAWPVSKTVSLLDRRILGLGPVPRPALTDLVGPDGLLAIPEPFDWSSLQAARPDQRLDALTGHEWLALSGIYPSHPVLMTHLGGVTAAARLHGEAPNLRAGWPIPLRADTLRIDTDQRTCTLAFRGQVPVTGLDALPSMHVVAGLELPGRPLAWIDPFARPAPPPPPPARKPPPPLPAAALAQPTPPPASEPPTSAPTGPAPGVINTTTALDPEMIAALRAKPALPFQAKPPPAVAEVATSTIAIDPDMIAALRAATPFEAPAPAAYPAPPPPTAYPVAAAHPVAAAYPAVPPPSLLDPLPPLPPAPLVAPAPPIAPPPPPGPIPVAPAAPLVAAAAAPPAPEPPAASVGDDFLEAMPKDEPKLSPTERLAARRRKG